MFSSQNQICFIFGYRPDLQHSKNSWGKTVAEGGLYNSLH